MRVGRIRRRGRGCANLRAHAKSSYEGGARDGIEASVIRPVINLEPVLDSFHNAIREDSMSCASCVCLGSLQPTLGCYEAKQRDQVFAVRSQYWLLPAPINEAKQGARLQFSVAPLQ